MSAPEEYNPVKVLVDNWPERKRKIDKTTLRTFILDPASTGQGGRSSVQIADYEAKRIRMTVRPIDADMTVTTEAPVKSPDVSSTTTPPQGAHLVANPTGYPEHFYGPDAFWANALTTITRVVVKKEYER